MDAIVPPEREIVAPLPNVKTVLLAKAPDVNIKVPETVVAPLRVTPALLLIVRFAALVNNAPVVCALLPLKT